MQTMMNRRTGGVRDLLVRPVIVAVPLLARWKEIVLPALTPSPMLGRCVDPLGDASRPLSSGLALETLNKLLRGRNVAMRPRSRFLQRFISVQLLINPPASPSHGQASIRTSGEIQCAHVTPWSWPLF
ncbi:MAG: hypothetical protein P3W97_004015 [Tepidimonas sp.]|uniref:hypothetical protein n=1 Tax=Tepidimonas sp. TaxID=2002775 RepID=UPI00259E330D|nr:hypothetical protein [Tepidimonas sp.]MDM7456424.1 hypothetical protein [Tepidimonas sp.]